MVFSQLNVSSSASGIGCNLLSDFVNSAIHAIVIGARLLNKERTIARDKPWYNKQVGTALLVAAANQYYQGNCTQKASDGISDENMLTIIWR